MSATVNIEDLSLDMDIDVFLERVLNNQELFKDTFNAMLELLDINTNVLKLTDTITSLPEGSIEALQIILTGTSGKLISFNPNGGTETFSVSFDGKIIGLNVTLSGEGTDKSVIKEIGSDKITVKNIIPTEKLDITGEDLIVIEKITPIVITSTFIGSSALTPLDLSSEYHVLLDCNNSGNPLVTSGEPSIKIDLTKLVPNQRVKLRLFKGNTSGVKLYNGESESIFANITPNAVNGYQDISSSNLPTFSTNTPTWLDLIYKEVSTGVFRLVILDSKNITGI